MIKRERKALAECETLREYIYETRNRVGVHSTEDFIKHLQACLLTSVRASVDPDEEDWFRANMLKQMEWKTWMLQVLEKRLARGRL
jgi:hypothetical protein